jgi:hypothetical protein
MTEEEAWAIVDSLPAVEDAASAVLNLENGACGLWALSAAGLVVVLCVRVVWVCQPLRLKGHGAAPPAHRAKSKDGVGKMVSPTRLPPVPAPVPPARQRGARGWCARARVCDRAWVCESLCVCLFCFKSEIEK